MKALKMAVALAFAAVSPVIAPTSAIANVALEEEVVEEGGEAAGDRYRCYYQYSVVSGGTVYHVYKCYRILA